MKSRRLGCWLAACLLVEMASGTPCAAGAAIRWVNNNYTGVRTGSVGSESNPYSTISAAYSAAVGGDTLSIVATGLAYSQGTLTISKQLTLQGSGGQAWVQNSGTSYTLDINTQNVTLDGLRIDANSAASPCIRVAKYADCSHFTVRNCRVHNGQAAGIDLRGIAYPLSNVLIENNTIDHFLTATGDAHGIVTDGSITNLTIRYNDISECSGDCMQFTPYAAGGVYASAIQVYGNQLYRANTNNAYYTTTLGVQAPENAIDIKEAYNLAIHDNVMHGFRAVATSSPAAILLRIRAGADIGGQISILSNVFYDVENAMTIDSEPTAPMLTGVVVARNTIYGIVDTGGDVRKGRGISLGKVTDLTLAHNTIDGSVRSQLYFIPDAGQRVTNFTCYSNLFANSSMVVDRDNDVVGTVTITNNGYFNCNANPWTSQGEAESSATIGTDGTGIFVNRASADYHLVDLGSPSVTAIDKGSTGYGELYLGSAPDLGANEYQPPNRAPAVDAGADMTAVYEGMQIRLHAAAGDPDGDSLAYSWTRTAGKTVTLAGADTADPSFTVPALDARSDSLMTFRVDVSDGHGGTAGDSVNVTVYMAGDANHDWFVNVGDLQTLVAAWGSQAGPPPSGNWDPNADCNGDGLVSVGDLQILVAHWGQSI